MVEYSRSEFEKKLMLLENTRDSIKSLSAWCLKRNEHYKSIISIWVNAFKKVKIEKRLTLFYLANDVIQYSRKKNYKFIDRWATSIQKIIPYVRDEKIQSKIARIIKIWNKLGVYDNSYLADLISLLTTTNQKSKLADPVQEFQIHALAVKIRSCVKLEQITDLKMINLREANLPLTNNEALQNMLKEDRTPSHKFLNELNDGMSKIESYVKCLKQEILCRAQLLNALEVAKSFYAEQNDEVKIVAPAYFYYIKKVKLVQSELQSLVGSMPTDGSMPLPGVNAPPFTTSSMSIEDVNSNNFNYDAVLNLDKYMMNFSIENSINVPFTVINNIKSYITTDMYTTVQASVGFPALGNHDQKSLACQFPCDAPSTSSDETFAYSAFPNQTNALYTNNMNIHTNSSTYSSSCIEACVSTSMSSRQQFINPESSNNMVHLTNLSSPIRENTKPVFHIPQRAWDVTVHNDWSTTDTPASPPFHEKISYQNSYTFSKTDRGLGNDHSNVTSKLIDRDERVSQEMITKISDIDHRNLISLTHLPPINSSMVSVDIDYRAFPGISIPTASSDFLMEAVSEQSKVVSVVMNLSKLDDEPMSNHDQKLPVVLPLPFPPPMPFDYDQQCIPDVTNQWEQSSQLWNNDRPSFNESQWNIEQSDQWKHPYQPQQEQSDSNIVHNQPQLQWPRHVQRSQSKEYFRPKWQKGNCNWPRGPKNFISHSRPTGNWNQGPRFGPRNRP